MPQIFTASANIRLHAAVLLAAVMLLAAVALGSGLADSSFATAVGWVRDQPVPFSHQHHVGSLGIGCRYCPMPASRRAPGPGCRPPMSA